MYKKYVKFDIERLVYCDTNIQYEVLLRLICYSLLYAKPKIKMQNLKQGIYYRVGDVDSNEVEIIDDYFLNADVYKVDDFDYFLLNCNELNGVYNVVDDKFIFEKNQSDEFPVLTYKIPDGCFNKVQNKNVFMI